MDRLKIKRRINWERIGWLTLQTILALAIIFTLATIFATAAVVAYGIVDFLEPLIDRFGLALLPVPFVSFGVLYIGWKLAGWIMETVKRNHYDRWR